MYTYRICLHIPRRHRNSRQTLHYEAANGNSHCKKHVHTVVDQSIVIALQHTATHLNTHCNTLQPNATHCNTLQHTAIHCNILQYTAIHCSTLQYTATHCNTQTETLGDEIMSMTLNTLQHTAIHCNILQQTGGHIGGQDHDHDIEHTATHCDTLQHTATRRRTQLWTRSQS